ncbi:hypothetical protein D6817_00015, partial [Candidatus Pacearchaeota archaeon]
MKKSAQSLSVRKLIAIVLLIFLLVIILFFLFGPGKATFKERLEALLPDFILPSGQKEPIAIIRYSIPDDKLEWYDGT